MFKMFARLFAMVETFLVAGENIGKSASISTGVLVAMATTYELDQMIELATKQAALKAKRTELGLD